MYLLPPALILALPILSCVCMHCSSNHKLSGVELFVSAKVTMKLPATLYTK